MHSTHKESGSVLKTAPIYLPLERFSLDHFVVAPVPRDVVVHAAVAAEQRHARAKEDADAHISRLHYLSHVSYA